MINLLKIETLFNALHIQVVLFYLVNLSIDLQKPFLILCKQSNVSLLS